VQGEKKDTRPPRKAARMPQVARSGIQ